MTTMNDFLGHKTKEQIKMIRAIVNIKDSGKSIFSSREISERTGIPTRGFGGAFMALANIAGEYPALVIKAGRERVELTNGKRRYIQFWRPNPNFDWAMLAGVLKFFGEEEV